MKVVLLMLLSVSAAPAQEPAPQVPPAQPAPTPAPAARADDQWTEGFGRAPSYRQALVQAIEDAVGKAKGIGIARGAGVRSRLAVVADGAAGVAEGDVAEREWVQHQISGFVQRYEITKKEKAQDGEWEITLRAQVARAASDQAIVVDLAGDSLGSWKLERYEEDGPGEPFGKLEGNYKAPALGDHLRASGSVLIAAKSAGAVVGDDAAPGERDKAKQRLVPSHRVTVTWQPMTFRSLVERPNAARPTLGPRPQYVTSGTIDVTVKIVDLVRDIELYDRPMSISLDLPQSTPVDRLDALVVQLADRAMATVAETVVFTLRPPVVTRKWAGDSGEWMVEANITRRVAQEYREFTVGNIGSLTSPDWRPLGRAVFVGSADGTSTFKLVSVDDPGAIEANVTEVRPAKN